MDLPDIGEGLLSRLTQLVERVGNNSEALLGATTLIPVVGDKLDKLTNRLQDQFEVIDGATKTSMSIGFTLDQSMQRLDGTIMGLQGNFIQRFQASILPLEEGLRGNTEKASELINQQQLTGQNFSQTAAFLRKMQLFLEDNTEASEALTTGVLRQSDQYNITTSRLIDSLDDLSNTLVVQRALGFDTQTQEAITEVIARAGAGFEGPVKELTQLLFSTSEDDLMRQVVGFGPDALSRLQSAGSPEAQAEMIVGLGEQLSNTIQGALEGADSPESRRMTLQALGQVYGSDFVNLGLELSELRRSFDEAQIDTGQAIDPGATVQAAVGVIDVMQQRGKALIAPEVQGIASDVAGGLSNFKLPELNDISDTVGNSLTNLGGAADDVGDSLIYLGTSLLGITTIGQMMGVNTSPEAIKDKLEDLTSGGSVPSRPQFMLESRDYTNKSLLELYNSKDPEQVKLLRQSSESLQHISSWVESMATRPKPFHKKVF